MRAETIRVLNIGQISLVIYLEQSLDPLLMDTKLDSDWLEEQLDLVFQYSDELEAQGEVVGPEYNSKSVLKFAKLAGAIQLYTDILGDTDKEIYYIDALAGSGMMKLKRPGETIVTSPIIAPAVARKPFDEYHYFESNEKRCEALSERLEYLSNETEVELDEHDWEVHEGDANKNIPELMSDIRERAYQDDVEGVNAFRFVDNHGKDIHWSTIQDMAQTWGDFLITFPSHSMPMDAGAIDSEDSDKRANGFTQFFGNERWRPCSSPDDFAKLYQRRIEEEASEYDVISIKSRVRGSEESRGAYYDLIWSTRRTHNNSPYKKGIQHIQQRIRRNSGRVVEDFIDLFKNGDQTSLDLYAYDEDDTEQSGLENFT